MMVYLSGLEEGGSIISAFGDRIPAHRSNPRKLCGVTKH